MEKIIGLAFLIIILFLMYFSMILYNKRYLQKVREFDIELQNMRSKISILESKFDVSSIEKEELANLSKEVLDLHGIFLKQFITKQ